MKKILTLLVMVVLVATTASPAIVSAATEGKYVSLCVGQSKAIQNGTQGTTDAEGSKPFIVGGRTMVPLRFVSEKMGAKVSYVNLKSPITVTYKDSSSQITTVVKFTIDSKKMQVTTAGKTSTITIDVPAQIKNSRTYIPLRAIAQSLGFQVYWHESTQIIVVSNPKMDTATRDARVEEMRRYLNPSQNTGSEFIGKSTYYELATHAKKLGYNCDYGTKPDPEMAGKTLYFCDFRKSGGNHVLINFSVPNVWAASFAVYNAKGIQITVGQRSQVSALKKILTDYA